MNDEHANPRVNLQDAWIFYGLWCLEALAFGFFVTHLQDVSVVLWPSCMVAMATLCVLVERWGQKALFDHKQVKVRITMSIAVVQLVGGTWLVCLATDANDLPVDGLYTVNGVDQVSVPGKTMLWEKSGAHDKVYGHDACPALSFFQSWWVKDDHGRQDCVILRADASSVQVVLKPMDDSTGPIIEERWTLKQAPGGGVVAKRPNGEDVVLSLEGWWDRLVDGPPDPPSRRFSR